MDVFKFSKKGDRGETSLLTGERVSKASLRPEAYGTLDEASSALGLARAFTRNSRVVEMISTVQEEPARLGRSALLRALAARRAAPSARNGRSGWKNGSRLCSGKFPCPVASFFPGPTPPARRSILPAPSYDGRSAGSVGLRDAGELDCPEVHAYLNRLADFLFTLARYAERED